jgi:hypothetical protein
MLTRAVVAITVVVRAFGLSAVAQTKPRLFVSDSKSWEQAGGFAATMDGAGGASSGGARPQTAEIIKTVGERCPDVTVTMRADKADYVLLLEHEGGKGLLRKDNKYALFNSDGDAIKSGSTRNLGNAIKDSCAALLQDWKTKPRTEATPPNARP